MNFSTHWKYAVGMRLAFAIAILSLCLPTISHASGSYDAEVQACLKWLEQHSHKGTGLPFSHVGDPKFRNWTTTYDAAVTALAYLGAGETEKARRILDYYRNTPDVWRLGGVMEAYVPSKKPKGKDFAVRSGANMWMGLAFAHFAKKTGELKYMSTAERIANLGLAMQNKKHGDPNYGGIPMGPKGDPKNPTDQRQGYRQSNPSLHELYSSEINIDAYALLRLLYDETGKAKYDNAAQSVLKWIKIRSYNPKTRRLDRGYRDAQSASDVQSWGVSALGLNTLDTFERGLAEKMLSYVENNCMSQVVYEHPSGKQVRVRGVDFVDKKTARAFKRKPLVSPEWTFQLVNAYRRMEGDYLTAGNRGMAQASQRKWKSVLSEGLKVGVPENGALGFPYATEASAMIGHENRTPAEGNMSAIGAAYAILAMTGFDPLAP